MYAAKRSCCGPGAEDRFVPTKQFYTKMSVYNTVVLSDTPRVCTRAFRSAAGDALLNLSTWDVNRIGLSAIGQALASEDYGVASVSNLAPALSFLIVSDNEYF